MVFLGAAGSDELDPIVVPARQVVTFDPGEVTGLAEGRHATVFSTLAEPSIVVERALTKIVDGQPSTTVVLGAVQRLEDAYVATAWTMAIGPSVPTEAALVVFNVDNAASTVSVEAVGAGGPVVIPGLEAIPLAPAGLITIDLTDAAALDRELIVRSTHADHGRAVVARRRRTRTVRQLGPADDRAWLSRLAARRSGARSLAGSGW